MQFTAWPEMLAWPYLILKGFLPYQDIAIAHNPLLLFVLAGFYKLFGVGVFQLQVFTALIIIFTAYLIYQVTKKWYTPLIYIILCFVYQGWGLWFDLLLAPIALLLYKFVNEKKWLMAGIVFALGFLTKQTFVYFLIPILLNKVNIKKFIFGAIPVFGLFALYLISNNLVSSYYQWAIQFGIFYLPKTQGQIQLPNRMQYSTAIFPFALFVYNFPLAIWILAGFMGIYPRWELFHFQPALPFLAIVMAQTLRSVSRQVKFVGIVILLVLILLTGRKIYREKNLETRFYENDVKKTVSLLTTHNPPLTSVYVINYWDNIYTLTNTLPPKPLIPYIPWYLGYANNYQLTINNLQLNMPEALVVNDRQKLNFEKLQTFINRYYACNIVEKEVEVCFKN